MLRLRAFTSGSLYDNKYEQNYESILGNIKTKVLIVFGCRGFILRMWNSTYPREVHAQLQLGQQV